MATLADGTTVTAGMIVRVIERHLGFDGAPGDVFTVKKAIGKDVIRVGGYGGDRIPAAKCVQA